VRGEVLEDVLLGRVVKRSRLRLVACAAPDDLSVKMYHGWDQVRAGFRKNLFALLGGCPASFAAGVGVFLLTAVYPFVAAARGTRMGLLALGLLVSVRVAAAALFSQGWRTVLLHPLGAVLALWIAAESFATRGRVEWRGRWVGGGDGLETHRWNGTKSAFADWGSAHVRFRTSRDAARTNHPGKTAS
jgi:hypothetical protein